MGISKYSDTGLVKVDLKKVVLVKSIHQIIPDSAMENAREGAFGKITAVKSNVESMAKDYEDKQREIVSNQIEWHRKFTLSVACIVLFLIG